MVMTTRTPYDRHLPVQPAVAHSAVPMTQETTMSNLRHIVISVTILASFLLVLAAPFRWF
jgi:hypothetical protein